MSALDELPTSAPPPYHYYTAYDRATPKDIQRYGRSKVIACLGLLFGFLAFIRRYPNFSGDALILPDGTEELRDGLEKCTKIETLIGQECSSTRSNPRWIAKPGKKRAIILRNATLFDGEAFVSARVDIRLEKGVISDVKETGDLHGLINDEVEIVDLGGSYVTPGLVDMHSHHLVWPFHSLPATRDVNETPLLGPITPFVRSIDGFKPYDPAIEVIAGGGVTSSLILPGSANIIGGQAYVVKNVARSGPDHEPIVEELLLDHGIDEAKRVRYMKMACGENPKHTYLHTRLGNVWLLREHFSKAREIQQQQDQWCQAGLAVSETGVNKFVQSAGRFPDPLEYEPTIAMLRGQVNINIHCYEPEDLERMLAVLHEFNLHPRAFHHALEAWQVPELLKAEEQNVTIATFAENAFFKAEAYGASLRAGKVLAEHGVAVAYKSDHTGEGNNAKYLLHQAAVAHSFGLASNKALQAITSVPARSIQQDHRIGYVKPGYDADLVVWDSHPLSIGATATQVYIDGHSVLDPEVVSESLFQAGQTRSKAAEPKARPQVSDQERHSLCSKMTTRPQRLIFTGIQKVYSPHEALGFNNLANATLVVDGGEIICFGLDEKCASSADDGVLIHLKDGHVTPGLVAVSQTLGLVDITGEPSTSDGTVDPKAHVASEESIDFAKYGLHSDSRGLERARLGGISKAVTVPQLRGGTLRGVSVAFRTSNSTSILDGGIYQEDVALHFELSQASKAGEVSTISAAIKQLRTILSQDPSGSGIYARACNGSLPVVIHAVNTDIIRQIIWLKRDFPNANLVIFGGHGAPLVAEELAQADISVILTANRGVPDTWEKRDALSGPPLTRSPASVLAEAGVKFGLAIQGDSHIHNLASEAGWAARYAGLGEADAIALVSTNIEEILRLKSTKLKPSSHALGDFVVWEGNPLRGEGSVVLSVHEDGGVGACWPDE
ncbi:hypothetical protein M409DRAFT_48443 [Zasmidium cellare ATCC 36951]|uniref:Amidohydrolase-related domain-containing protein n=1 Tax=Zasmidium cellare ATCC 36951 TaxID=1080233 RepID=A0A6A6D525_ZASCE|nr:uncharacterized protein M409DRAFT_48443 [Zasmidium cellare ATCC 36951]KAF2173470.1 hypothetical protein M409DRAFT_48443 [Zasmidium cellare ATCC 36951]